MSFRLLKYFLFVIAIIFLAALFFLATEKNAPSQPEAAKESSVQKEASSENDVIHLGEATKNIALPGKELALSDLSSQYGDYAFKIFKNYPEMIGEIKNIDPTFNPEKMDPSFPVHAYQLENGGKYLAFGGCTAHNCGGTGIFAIFEEKSNATFLAKENESQAELQFFGNPTAKERDLLVYYYYHK
jgi:hypothetical protein